MKKNYTPRNQPGLLPMTTTGNYRHIWIGEMENFYIICGNYSEYIRYVNRTQTFKPLDKRLLFVTDREIFRGTVNPTGIFVGSWRDRLDIDKLMEMLYVCMRDPIKAGIIRDIYAKHFNTEVIPFQPQP
jgi:hypothetical protein